MSMTARTSEDPLREWHRVAMPTRAACLARIGRINFDELASSFFRFGAQLGKEGRPGGVCNAFSKTMIVNHPVDSQIFYSNDAKVIDDFPAFLMGEVGPSPCDTFMDPCHGLAMFPAFFCTFRHCAMLALHVCQCLFLCAEKPGIGNLFPSRERGKGFQANVYSYLRGAFGQASRLTLNAETGIPFAGTALVKSERFELAPHGAMQHNLDMPNAGSIELALLIDLEAGLWIGEAIITVMSLETRIAWRFTCLDSSEEGFHGKIKSDSHLLQHLGMHRCQGRTFLFEYRERGLLLIQAQTLAFQLIGGLSLFKQVVVEPPTFIQCLLQQALLLFRRKYPVLEHLTHMCYGSAKHKCCQMKGGRPFIPRT